MRAGDGDLSGASDEPESQVRATVVIRALNEVRHIGACLDAVLGQDEPCSVLVIDSGSTDGTVEEVRRRPAVRLHEIPKASFTYGYACNLGARLSSTPFVCYLSAHALPADDGWLRQMLAPFDDPRVAGVWGRQLPRPGQDPLRAYWQLQGNTDSAETVLTTFSNANSAVRRADWEAAPFDEALEGSEDYDWKHRMEAAGRLVRYAPGAAAYHSHPESLRQTYRRYRNEAEGMMRWEPPWGRRHTLVVWRACSRRDFDRLRAEGQLRWAVWAPLYYGAMFAGRLHGQHRSLQGRTRGQSPT